jgi:hypothetical protein
VAEAGMEAGDFNIGKQLPNYMLHPVEWPYFGIDLPKDLLKELADEFAKKAGLWNGTCVGTGCLSSGNLYLILLWGACPGPWTCHARTRRPE